MTWKPRLSAVDQKALDDERAALEEIYAKDLQGAQPTAIPKTAEEREAWERRAMRGFGPDPRPQLTVVRNDSEKAPE